MQRSVHSNLSLSCVGLTKLDEADKTFEGNIWKSILLGWPPLGMHVARGKKDVDEVEDAASPSHVTFLKKRSRP